jgi:hypothetical protein
MKVHNFDDKRLSLLEVPKVQESKRRLSADDILSRNVNRTLKLSHISNVGNISEASSIALIEQNSHDQEELPQHNSGINKKLLFTSSLCGIGVGLAMMPIFNNEIWNLENYGIHIHEYEAAFIVSTINTLLVTSACSILSLYHYFNTTHEVEELTSSQKTALNVGKVGAVASSILPVALLWNIELHDQQVSESSGFDKFVAWAVFTTIPLLILKIVEAYEAMSKVIKGEYDNINLDSIGSKLVTYGTAVLSATARGIAFSAATEELANNIGFDEDTSKVLGILIGGILGSVVSGITEHMSVKSLFKTTEGNFSKREIATCMLSAAEGMWFALPTVSVGLNATKSWNPLLRGGVFAPFFVSKAVTEATSMYNALTPKKSHVVNQIT